MKFFLESRTLSGSSSTTATSCRVELDHDEHGKYPLKKVPLVETIN